MVSGAFTLEEFFDPANDLLQYFSQPSPLRVTFLPLLDEMSQAAFRFKLLDIKFNASLLKFLDGLAQRQEIDFYW